MFDDDDANDSELVKNLRKQVEKLGKEKAEAIAERDAALGKVRASSVQSLLSELGASPKLATYIPTDLDPSEETVRKWLEDNADVFNVQVKPKAEQQPDIKPPEGEEPPKKDEQKPDDAEAWSRIQNPESVSPPDIDSATRAWFAKCEELAGGDAERFIELINTGPQSVT